MTDTTSQHGELEQREQPNLTPVAGRLMLTPPVGETYWSHRVQVGEGQAVLAFPKFLTVGIGFAVEAEDWNCNLPWTSSADEIYEHIAHNKGDDSISRETCVEAIRMIQDAIRATPTT